MSTIIDVIRKVIRTEIEKIHTLELGIITSTFPHSEKSDKDNYDCNVKLRNKEIELRRVPVSTQHIGLSNPLHVGDLVLVSFIHGDFNSPVITGRLYNDEDRPPLSKMEEIVYQPSYTQNNDLRRLNIILPNGIVNLNLQDNQINLSVGKSSMNINDNGDIVLNSVKDEKSKQDGFKIAIDNKSYQAQVTNQSNISSVDFDDQGGIRLQANPSGKKCEMNLESGGLKIDTTMDIEITTNANLTINCTGGMTIDCKGDLTIDAMNININSKTSTNFGSSGIMNVKGSIVNIN